MIKINLASTKSSPASSGIQFGEISTEDSFVSEEARKEALKRIVVILIPAICLYAYQEQHVPELQSRLGSLQATLSELENYNSKQAASVAEIKKFKEDEAVIEARISALDKISRDRSREIRVIDLMQQVIPEKAWLTKVSLTPERINIQGLGMSDFEVSQFLEALTKSVFLMDVNLVSSTEVTVDNMILKKFEISAVLERTTTQ
ncbi:PilN domain-containing protein [Bdellovibrio sp. SKB1291214]|uniref:PilN domain-containing protein n=1 Tax=Bdellovibrio sp. SKB1291214 TaxID=1732569 RepID=UPI000B5179BD|nr:PilN domain-containing protein [Bdellovibrio sp. SKB1291214]UYL08965.1 PilN domain-containing protein [Bdellovibrio sp. SKB1291214]